MLRLGILIEGKNTPGWVNEIVQKICQKKDIECSIIILTHSLKADSSVNACFRWFRQLDNRLLPGKPDLSREIELKLPKHITVLETSLMENGKKHSLSPEDYNQVTKIKPDLLFYFGSNLLSKEILSLPKLGVWTLYFGNIIENWPYNSPAGFWEWFHRMPVSTAAVVRLGEEPEANECLANAITRTDFISFSRNQTAIYSTGIELLLHILEKAILSEKLSAPSEPTPLFPELSKNQPDFRTLLLASWKLLYRITSKLIYRIIYIEQWVLFYSFPAVDLAKPNFDQFIPLIPPKDSIWADPFVVSRNGYHYVFIEELFKKTNKGHINCLVLNNDGKIEASKTIIDKPYHLSYPFVFQHNDVWYMIPESAENRTVDLFECTDFPFEWKFKRTLLTNVEAFDSTLHFQDGHFWLFCTIKESAGGSSDDHLYLFSSKDFLKESFERHSANPIVSNPYNARPAGRIFFHNNLWYRPSQICVPRYGYGLSINKITGFDQRSYKEESVTKILPEWRNDLMSVHTFNFNENITLVDGQLRRFRF